MQKLQDWMIVKGERDETLAPKLGITRVQMSRIRRSVNGASKRTALELERLTNIPWYEFIGLGQSRRLKGKASPPDARAA